MKIRRPNNVNFVSTMPIRPGKRYWAFPANINNPNRNAPQLIVTEYSLRQLMRHDPNGIGRMYAQVPIHRIDPGEILFRHPIQRNRNVTKANLREYIAPLYMVKSPRPFRSNMSTLRRKRPNNNNNRPTQGPAKRRRM